MRLREAKEKVSKGYHGFEFNCSKEITLEQDLARRDLSMNAMAMDRNQVIFDPYHGQKAIRDKLIEHVSPAFAEDPVRILRVARFAARYADLGFKVSNSTLDLMRTMVEKGEVDALGCGKGVAGDENRS